jgi:hypothetical protein
MSRVAQMSVTVVQLAGGLAVTKLQIAAKSASVTVAQPASPFTPSLKAEASSVMQVEYCATVAVQPAGMALQLAMAELAFRHALCWLAQFCCN